MQCPECRREFNGKSCGCGYRVSSAGDWSEKPFIPCKYPGCHESATLRVGKEGNLCRKHYDEYWQTEAQAFCEEHKLNSLAEKRAFCRANQNMPAPGKDWARKIIEGYEMGLNYSEISYRFACEAMRRDMIQVEGETF